MDKLQSVATSLEREPGAADLTRRLARFRRRVEAEGRQRSVSLLDRAIEDVCGDIEGAG